MPSTGWSREVQHGTNRANYATDRASALSMNAAVATVIRRYASAAVRLDPSDRAVADAAAAAVMGIDERAAAAPSDLWALIDRIAEIMPPDAALRIGASERLADLGLVGHAIASALNLRSALEIWLAQTNSAEALLSHRSRVQDSTWRIGFAPRAVLSKRAGRFVSEEWLAAFFAFLREVTGHDGADAQIELTGPPTPGIDYRAWLPVAPQFRRRANRLSLPASILDRELRSRDDETLAVLLRHLAHRDDRDSIADQLRKLFAAGAERQTVPAAAAVLGMSPRTLARRLADEGTTFGQVLDTHRRDYAIALAGAGNLSAKEIAAAVGFDTHQSLRRAFQRWTAMPLRRWRAQHADK